MSQLPLRLFTLRLALRYNVLWTLLAIQREKFRFPFTVACRKSRGGRSNSTDLRVRLVELGVPEEGRMVVREFGEEK